MKSTSNLKKEMVSGKEDILESKAMRKDLMVMVFLFMILEPGQKLNGKMEKEMGNVYTLLLMGISMSPNTKMEN